MNKAKVLGFGFIGMFGVAALVGCGGGGDASPTLVLTNDNAKTAASQALVDSSSVTNINIPAGDASAFAPLAVKGLRQALARAPIARAPGADATTTTPCTGGGSTTVDGTDPAPGALTANETVTYTACVEDGTTTDGTLKVNGTESGTTISLSISLNLTIKSAAATVVETGGLTTTIDLANLGGTSHTKADQISVSITSATVNDKITLSNLDVATTIDSATGDTSSTETYSVNSTRLGGLYSVDTDAAIVTSDLSLHPHAGEITITGAKNTALKITVLGDETFTPPAGQGQVKIELDSGSSVGATVYASWDELVAASSGAAGV
jgi:hypothetical protein